MTGTMVTTTCCDVDVRFLHKSEVSQDTDVLFLYTSEVGHDADKSEVTHDADIRNTDQRSHTRWRPLSFCIWPPMSTAAT